MTMNEQSAILLDLAIQLRKSGSWAGETHVQKAAFILQELLGVPVGFKFVLYKHGPFSFDLRDLLNQMEGERRILLEEQPYPYGPKIVEGATAATLRRNVKAPEIYARQIGFVTEQLGNASVTTLERIATALLVAIDSSVPAERRAQRLVELKPHVSLAEAKATFSRLQQIRENAIQAGLAPIA